MGYIRFVREIIMSRTVFCEECEHFYLVYANCSCSAPENGKPNFRGPRDITRAPKDINKNNGCKWFIPKRPFWKILLGIK